MSRVSIGCSPQGSCAFAIIEFLSHLMFFPFQLKKFHLYNRGKCLDVVGVPILTQFWYHFVTMSSHIVSSTTYHIHIYHPYDTNYASIMNILYPFELIPFHMNDDELLFIFVDLVVMNLLYPYFWWYMSFLSSECPFRLSFSFG